MSLPTPPRTSHRHKQKEKEKENKSSSTRVVWSTVFQYHSLATSPKCPPTTASASKSRPSKSILKKRSPILIFPPAEPLREVTPEPSDPLVDLKYLDGPVGRIINATDNPRDLIEAYTTLTARLRASVDGTTDVDASWPLFQPLRKNTEAFVDAVIRDLGRALIDPATVFPKSQSDSEWEDEEPEEKDIQKKVLLPSPTNTPTKSTEGEKKKKKSGMTAEQVKYARDLCTTCHAAIRLLGLIFTLPALQNVFTEKNLREMLMAHLSIVQAPELPTPNARKTYALAIWLLQAQRLPEPVLFPARFTIAYALRRGVEGELGKEGKKGSVNDGLKAISDLSPYLPQTFVPIFTTTILPALLSNLLAPTLALRVQACHALAGFVRGVLLFDFNTDPGLRARIEDTVIDFMTRPSASTSPRKPGLSPKSPTKQEAAIIRTLRTTLTATAPTHAAHGPVWGLCVLTGLLVLLGGRVVDNAGVNRCNSTTGNSIVPGIIRDKREVGRVVGSLAALGMAHGRSSVRALGCLMWRGVIWGWFMRRQGDARALTSKAQEQGEDGESEVDTESEGGEEEVQKKETLVEKEGKRKAEEKWWKVVSGVVELRTGVCIVRALLSESVPSLPSSEDYSTANELWNTDSQKGDTNANDYLHKTLQVLTLMAGKNEQTCEEAIDTLKQLVGVGIYSSPDPHTLQVSYNEGPDDQEGSEDSVSNNYTGCELNAWNPATILPYALFDSLPSLMTVDFKALASVLHPIYDAMPGAEDVRMLAREEVMRGWGMCGPEMDDEEIPETAQCRDTSMWEGLVRVWRACLARVGDFKGNGETGEGEVAYEKDLVAVWEGLIGQGLGYLQETGDEESITTFIVRVIDVLIEILQDSALELVSASKVAALTSTSVLTSTPASSSSSSPEKKNRVKSMKPKGGSKKEVLVPVLDIENDIFHPISEETLPRSSISNPNTTQKLRLIRHLWSILRTLVPSTSLVRGAERLLVCLMKGMEEFTDACDSVQSVFSPSFGMDRNSRSRSVVLENEEALTLWAELCVDVLVVCGVEALRAFWGHRCQDPDGNDVDAAWEWSWGTKERALVWNVFVDKWGVEKEEGWEGIVCLLGVPFMDKNIWGLSAEDVSRWQDLLEHAVNKALDFGVDTVTVLDTLACSISQHNPPISLLTASTTSSSSVATASIQLVDLILSCLDTHIADVREMPEGLLDFVGNTLREAYPPTPLSAQAYLWTARTVMKVLDACPRELVSSLLEGVMEGLGIWIEDGCKAWSEAELAYDIISLYEHILCRIQGLPCELETLRMFAGIIESPFCGRKVMIPAATETFIEFWQATYARLDHPLNYWPEEIQNCLKIAMTSSESLIEEHVTSPMLAPAFCAAPSPPSPLPDTCSKEVITSVSPKPEPSKPTVPSTPTSFNILPKSTPSPCFSKLPPAPITDFSLPLRSPKSPVRSCIPFPSVSSSPLSPMRTPATPKRTPRSAHVSFKSTKRRRIGDKENESPYLPVRSVAERIAAHVSEDESWTLKPFMLGKRRLDDSDDSDGRPSPLKKGRKINQAVKNDNKNEKSVKAAPAATKAILHDVFNVTPIQQLAPPDMIELDPPSLKKRKRILMDAVVVPTLRQVYPSLRHASSFDSLGLGLRTPSSSVHSTRQTRSATKASVRVTDNTPSRKRRRASAADVLSSSSPIRVPDVPHSDSFTIKKAEESPPSLPSSDDDPHIGQVIPHHLISPELRRTRVVLFEEPSSDDSVIHTSPSKQVSERRLQRLGSLNQLPKPIPFVI